MVTEHPIHFRNWTLKGNDIYHLSDTDSSFYVECFNVRTGSINQINEIKETRSIYLDVSPDRRWIIYSQYDQVESDIMLVENFH